MLDLNHSFSYSELKLVLHGVTELEIYSYSFYLSS